MTSSQVTAPSSLEAIAAAAHADARAALHTLSVPDVSGTPGARRKHARIPAHHRDEGKRHRETAGHRVRLWVLITTAATKTRQEGGTAPPVGAADLADARSLPEQLKHR